MNYYISDTHFGHKNILKYETNRPGNSIEEMQNIMVERWNTKVKPTDDVYILGDFAFKGASLKSADIDSLLNNLNGKKHLIRGNHDEWYDKSKLKDKIDVHDILEIEDGLDYLILCHYPIEVWNHRHHGAIHLHGHTHATCEENTHVPNRYNVGCMWYNYEPVTLEEIKNNWKRGNKIETH